jgi:hypothetical protein
MVVVVHLAFVAFFVIGGFLAWRAPGVLWAHVPAVLVSAFLAITGLDCPLDTLEKWLRRRGGQTPYRGGFIAHYLVEPIRGTGIDGTLHLALRVLAVAVVVVAYAGLAVRHRPTWRRAAVAVD